MSNTIAHREFSLPTSDKQTLFAQEWTLSDTASSTKQPTIGFVHGLGEHSGRYSSVAAFFVKHGYRVIGYDHRGHGKTAGPMPSFEILQNDIQSLCNYAKETSSGPMVLYGQSLGGALVLKFLAEKHTDKVTAAIVSSPLLTPTHAPPRLKVFFGELLLPWFPRLQLAHGLKPRDLTHDESVVEKFRRDPLVRRTVSIALGYTMLESGRKLLKSTHPYHIPMLLMHGSDDQITSAESTRQFAQHRPHAALKIWDGLFHELHFENKASEILDFVRLFIEDNL
jgi:acylglycerol lipase